MNYKILRILSLLLAPMAANAQFTTLDYQGNVMSGGDQLSGSIALSGSGASSNVTSFQFNVSDGTIAPTKIFFLKQAAIVHRFSAMISRTRGVIVIASGFCSIARHSLCNALASSRVIRPSSTRRCELLAMNDAGQAQAKFAGRIEKMRGRTSMTCMPT
jgi:hypothetical protein